MNSVSITKIYCPYCGRCIAMRHIKNKRAISRTLCKQPATEKEDEMIETLKCIKCKEIVYVTYEVAPAS